ncbi:bifunctional tetrahydrofolate synthase/dihydrofolate synthase [Aestuariirhabdus litorea]|uniref:Dihydrofolate synthase/folylpolyglutamate synthase n=1 Tax=Aestuariirhabdus litorea TaxID=2528527 RepID=A0A3P3VQM2_9GAMM|nr:bifunctional tetrahydrofolate synthase/dihydrofolate synthase [Aestuariirhabdus litorea]RRJ84920.1 bifunctional tetrahydrofolate synthase/dihydrofolate synthase [Aestuariirhabdus litorea]RWW98145.1 bifunctional tetrahydrofolate synthase/dihydrofolate synthase [Endozoicomonadaceae bacterium GTF-13]
MRPDTLSAWLEFLEQLHPVEIDLGLERVASVAQTLNLLKPSATVFTVAGTNGKGSTCAFLASILQREGYRVGVYSSPHLLRYNERILIEGEQAGDQQIVDTFKRIDQARGDTSLSYFEFATLAALDLFERAALDVWILEVGLGGRLDAVNIIDADVSLVTSIAIDHEQWLGSSLEGIGREKAGVFRAGRPAIYGGREPNAGVSSEAERIGARWLPRGEAFLQTLSDSGWRYQGVDAKGLLVTLEQLPLPELPFDNAATAICALLHSPLPVSESSIREGIASATLAGRYQSITVSNRAGEPVKVVLDVAHNPQAAVALAERLGADPAAGQTRCVLAMLDDKDVEGVLEALAEYCGDWFLAEVSTPRASPASRLGTALGKIACDRYTLYSRVGDALIAAVEASSRNDRVLVAGSFFTVADALKTIEQWYADPA